MKKLFFAAVALAITFTSCKDSGTSSSTSTGSTIDSTDATNTEHMNMVYRGIESGDMSAMDAFVAEDIVDHYGMPEEIKGRDNVKKMLSDMHNHFTNLKMEMVSSSTSADHNYHFALVHMTGTTKDDKMGRPANTAVDAMSVDVVKMKDGKATEHWGFENPKEMMKMMQGHMPPPMEHMDMKKDTMKKM